MPSTATAPTICSAYTQLQETMRNAGVLAGIESLVSWDQETVMPAAGAPARAKQLAALATLIHERRTSDAVGARLDACEEDPAVQADPQAAANIREMRRDYDRKAKLPSSLVAEMTETASGGMEAWKDARAKNDFSLFAPWLEKTLELNRAKARCYAGEDASPETLYDALLDEFEPGMPSAKVDAAFGPLRTELVELIGEIADAPKRPDPSFREAPLPIEAQKAFNRWLVEQIGFDMHGGVLATSAHPFASSVAAGDTRLTTRYSKTSFFEAVLACVHEAGHGMYEQGLPKERFPGQPLSEAAGYGVHESQSRLWENQVGRTEPFWRFAWPKIVEIFGAHVDGFTHEHAFAAANNIKPSCIRVEADEVTYHLHIMLRYTIEKAMFTGELAVADVPAAWNDRFKQDFGLTVPDDARGCLQDVHWSMGAIGYFPSYSLGSLYAGSFYDAIQDANPGVEEGFAKGGFQPVFDWLAAHVHAHGRRFDGAQLVQRATGGPVTHAPLVAQMRRKLEPLYGLK